MQQPSRTNSSPRPTLGTALFGAGLALLLAASTLAQTQESTKTDEHTDHDRQVSASGHFVFEDGGAARPEPITALFRRLDEQRWHVVFDFPFNGQSHRWTAEFHGDLTGGAFRGEVTWPNGRRSRTWIVEGSTQDGLLRATHTERRRNGELQSTGKLTLRLR